MSTTTKVKSGMLHAGVASKLTTSSSAADEGKLIQLDASGEIPTGYIPYAPLLKVTESTSDPADPAEGRSVIWMSDGTGSGDDGDIMIKITAGGVTKTATLVDFSAA